jgi:hypothetical protein
LTTSKEFEVFRATMLAQFARLAEQAGRYVSRMSNNDRGVVLETALNLAWDLREEFNPTERTLLYYWDECLRGAIRGRNFWRLRYFDRWETVPAERIGVPLLMPE